MSKLSFRARALDASKPMPIYLSEELPDLPEYLSINRSVPQMPSGMEKEEESERHLQEAICAGKVIPTPEVFSLNDMGCAERFNELYPGKFKLPKQYIHYQSAYAFDNDTPEYDMDSGDERWLNAQTRQMNMTLSVDQFEEMMDRLEKGSGHQVLTLKEAKMLVNEHDDLIVAVYDYWLNKRLTLQYPLIPTVKTEKTTCGGGGVGAGTAQSCNPYLAFRRRLEKMQTRKNRKNDEASYEKMLRLRRELSRAVTLLEMIKRREKVKKQHLHLTVDIFEKRHRVGDYSGHLISDICSQQQRCASASTIHPAFSRPAFSSQPSHHHLHHATPQPAFHHHHQRACWPVIGRNHSKDHHVDGKLRRSYKKRKHARSHLGPSASRSVGGVDSVGDVIIDTVTSDEEDQCRPRLSLHQLNNNHHHARLQHPPHLAASSCPAVGGDVWQEDSEPDGEFTFHRKRGCQYHAPVSWWREDRVAEPPSPLPASCRRYHLASILRRPLGLIRQRLGRGGRLILDRAGVGSHEDSVTGSLSLMNVSTNRVDQHHTPHASLADLPQYESVPVGDENRVDGDNCGGSQSCSVAPISSSSPVPAATTSSTSTSSSSSHAAAGCRRSLPSLASCSQFRLVDGSSGHTHRQARGSCDSVDLTVVADSLTQLLATMSNGHSPPRPPISCSVGHDTTDTGASTPVSQCGGGGVTASSECSWRRQRQLSASAECAQPQAAKLPHHSAATTTTPVTNNNNTAAVAGTRESSLAVPCKRQMVSVTPSPRPPLINMKKLVHKAGQLPLNAS